MTNLSIQKSTKRKLEDHLNIGKFSDCIRTLDTARKQND